MFDSSIFVKKYVGPEKVAHCKRIGIYARIHFNTVIVCEHIKRFKTTKKNMDIMGGIWFWLELFDISDLSASFNYWALSRQNLCSGFWKSKTQTSLLSYTGCLEIWNFACSKPRYDTFQKGNNEGADQTSRMRRLACACVIRKLQKTGFLASRPYLFYYLFHSNPTWLTVCSQNIFFLWITCMFWTKFACFRHFWWNLDKLLYLTNCLLDEFSIKLYGILIDKMVIRQNGF